MSAIQTEKGSAMGKWILVAASILGAVLVISSIWSICRALINSSAETADNSSPQGSVVPANKATTMNTVLSQEEIERQYMAEQRTAPVIQAPVAAPPAVATTNRNNEEVILQRERTKANQLIIKRLKQYVSDNPNRDTRAIQEQIKKRENQGAQTR